MNVVINNCYGGFGLSEKAIHRFAELKGLTLYPEPSTFGSPVLWTIPQADRPLPLPEPWINNTEADRKAYSDAYTNGVLSGRDIPRDDPTLVSVIRELGNEANGDYANLKIVVVPDGVKWSIEEYDGNEWVAEQHQTWS